MEPKQPIADREADGSSTLAPTGFLRNKDTLAIVLLLVLTAGVTLFILLNCAYNTDPHPGYIEAFGHRLNDKPIRSGAIFDWFFRLTLASCLVVLAMLFLKRAPKDTVLDHLVYAVLLALASLSCIIAFGQYGLTRDNYFDAGDMFHYYLAPKYLSEVGYEDLYICAAAAQLESGRRLPDYMRDLRSNHVAMTRHLVTPAVIAEARGRFSDKRWAQFKQDVETFRQWHGPEGWQRRFADHGYNGTPGWNFFAYWITSRVAITPSHLTCVAMVNMYLMVIMFMAVLKAFGWRLGLPFIILFCVNYPDRYLLGGGLLRYFWLASLVIGLSCMKVRRYGWSGLFIALSTMLIIFPALFLLGIFLKWTYSFATLRNVPRQYTVFLLSAGATMVVIFGLSVSVGRGLGNWSEFHHQMELNSGRLASGRIGFVYNFIHPKEVGREDRQQPYEPRVAEYERARFLYLSWTNLSAVLVAVFVVLTIRLTGRLDDLCLTVLLGFGLFFLMFSTVRYYYAGLVGLPLMWHARMDRRFGVAFVLLLLLVMAAAYYYSTRTIYCFIYNTLLSGAFTAYLVLAVLYLYFSRHVARTAGSCVDAPSYSSCGTAL